MSQNLFFQYLSWHFKKATLGILKGWANILLFNITYFSIPVLLITLFSPWRGTRLSYGKRFDIGKYFEIFLGNLISRIIGAIIRTSAIISGLILEILLIAAGIIVLVFWLFIPLLVITSLFLAIFIVNFLSITSFLLLAFSLVTPVLLIKSFLSDNKPTLKAKNLSALLSKKHPELTFIFSRLLLNQKDVASSMSQSKDFKEIMQEGERIAKEHGHKEIGPGDLFLAAVNKDKMLQKLITKEGVTAKDIQEVKLWAESLEKKHDEQKHFWEPENLRRRGTLARNWTSGHTPTLDRFSIDISKEVKRLNFPRITGHTAELKTIERILSRGKANNVLLIGQIGSGKRSIVRELAVKSQLGETMRQLNYKRVVELDLSSLLTRNNETGEREILLDQIFTEVTKARNVILVINEFHNFVSTKDKAGMLDITGIISKYLASPYFPLIALTNFQGFRRDIEQNPTISRLLEKVEVKEISKEETLKILENVSSSLEQRHRKFISYPALRDIVALSDKYIQAVPFPKKALDLLDESMAYLAQTKERMLLPKHIAFLVSEKTQIPVGEMESKEKEMLLNLEDLIHKRIINQKEAVKEIASSLRRARTNISSRKGPMGSFLFMGPTGVGKTETAKALAAIYFGSESAMIRLDMSEFQNVQDISRFLGSKDVDGLLTTPVRENPFSLILLDELEKAHPNILNLFLQVLDEGHVTDGLGRKIDFTHTMIIATSNAGYQVILKAMREQKDFSTIKQEIFDYLFSQGTFRPEFLNRFDGVVLFQPLSKEHLLDIAGLMLGKLQRNLQAKGIELVITQPLKEKMAELGYNPQFGARDMRRVIQNKVENILATALLKGDIKRGDTIEIDSETFTIKGL